MQPNFALNNKVHARLRIRVGLLVEDLLVLEVGDHALAEEPLDQVGAVEFRENWVVAVDPLAGELRDVRLLVYLCIWQ